MVHLKQAMPQRLWQGGEGRWGEGAQLVAGIVAAPAVAAVPAVPAAAVAVPAAAVAVPAAEAEAAAAAVPAAEAAAAAASWAPSAPHCTVLHCSALTLRTILHSPSAGQATLAGGVYRPEAGALCAHASPAITAALFAVLHVG